MKPQELYQAGDLRGAIQASLDDVRQHPTDTGRRWFLAELLCYTGDWEKADRQLDTLLHQDPEAALGVGLFRQLVRAAEARHQFFADGRLPEFHAQPSSVLKLHLEASICVRENHHAEAAQLLAQAEEQRPHPRGTCDGQPFDDLRDLDDLTASFLEVLTSTGKYYWVALEQIEKLELRPPTRPRDLLWQRAHLIVHDGPDGEVYLPTVYAGTHLESDDRLRLGRATDWRGGDGTPVRGIGLRTLLVGEEARPILTVRAVGIPH